MWVSHDLGECRRNCSRVCVMENGQTGRITSLGELIAHPDCLSAAKLVGHRNFVPVQADAQGVLVPEWQLRLPRLRGKDDARTLCIPQAAIDCNGQQILCQVCRVIPDVAQTIVLLRPKDAVPESELLRVELPGTSLPAVGTEMRISLDPEKLLLL